MVAPSVLSEREARQLAGHIVKELLKLGMNVTNVGVHLTAEGFWFMAEINGRTVWARTGQGNFTYTSVALELSAAALKAAADPAVHVA
jgi:hypothetical protein